MTRRLLVVLAVLAALPAAATAKQRCSTNHLVKSNPFAVITKSGTKYYGCWKASGRRTQLVGADEEQTGPIRLAGRFVGIAWIVAGSEDSQVDVRDLRTGKLFHTAQMVGDAESVGPHVSALVLRGNGSVAWIGVGSYFDEATERYTYGVEKFDVSGRQLLDHGAAVYPNSLHLNGAEITWVDGAEAMSASLD
jgi:hypothetical protein